VARKKPPKSPTPPEKPPAKKADTIGQEASAELDESDGLSPMELRFIDMAATGESSMEEMAVKLGASARSLRRWKARPEVASAIRARTNESMSLARAVLAAGASRAARQLVDLAENAEPDSARIAACMGVIAQATASTTIEEIEAGLAKVEAWKAGKLGNRRN
jgi:thioredoxin-like negative regulator of GroEL